MSDRVFLIPATPELKVRKPVGGYLDPQGEEVELDSYWRRRLADSDVRQAQAPSDAKPPKATK